MPESYVNYPFLREEVSGAPPSPEGRVSAPLQA